MDIIFLVWACFFMSKKLRAKGYKPNVWIWRLVGLCISFEIIGFVVSSSLTSGNLVLAVLTGLVCAIGGFLLVNNRVDQLPEIKEPEEHNEIF